MFRFGAELCPVWEKVFFAVRVCDENCSRTAATPPWTAVMLIVVVEVVVVVVVVVKVVVVVEVNV